MGKVGVSAPEEVVKVERGPRKMDMIMLYDIDHGSRINARPDHGWWPLNPEYPDDPAPDFNSICRVTTPLMGTYDCTDPKLQKQHLYWISALGCNATKPTSPTCALCVNRATTAPKAFSRAFIRHLKPS